MFVLKILGVTEKRQSVQMFENKYYSIHSHRIIRLYQIQVFQYLCKNFSDSCSIQILTLPSENVQSNHAEWDVRFGTKNNANYQNHWKKETQTKWSSPSASSKLVDDAKHSSDSSRSGTHKFCKFIGNSLKSEVMTWVLQLISTSK